LISRVKTDAERAECADDLPIRCTNGLPSDASDEITETRAIGGDGIAMADTVPTPDRWQASKKATSWDHAQMLLSRWNSTIRSTVSKREQSEVDSGVISHGLESSTGEALNSVDDQGLEGTQQVSEERDCQQAFEETHRNETTSESKTLDTTEEENYTVHEAAAAALGDGRKAEMAMGADNSFADVSDTSSTSTNGSVAPDNAQVWGDTCQQVDASASLLDRAQVFWSQSVSAVRSQDSKHNRSEAEPSANTFIYQSPDLASGCAKAEQGLEVGSGCMEHRTTHEEAATDTKLKVEREEVAAISLEADLGTASADDTASDEASGRPLSRTDGGISTDDASVTEATCQQVDDHASLVDRAQVFWSQSLSAVRSKVPELTRYQKDPTADSSDASLDADVSPSEEVGTEATAFTDEMSDKMREVGTPASLRTLESDVELQVCAGSDEEPPMDGTIAPPVASPTSNAATHSVPTHTSDSEETHVNATHLDHVQVFTSLAMAALRSQVSAVTQPNSALTQPSSVIVA